LGFGNGGSWWRSVAWSTCFFGWKNMKCCGLNIKVSIPNVGIAVTIPNAALPGNGAAVPLSSYC
jgi:hypothetical protein